MIHFIPYVNNYPLLEKAYNSCRSLEKFCVVIIDNRDIGSNEGDPRDLNISEGHFVIRPPVPLSTAQTMNYMWRTSQHEGTKFFTWQHADSHYHFSCLEKLWTIANNSDHINWGVIHTNYDVLCAYNTQAITAINGWDYLRFPWYFLDNDLHIRLEKSEFKLLQANVGEVHHEPSSTIKSDQVRSLINSALFPVCEYLFLLKHPDHKNYGHHVEV